MDMHTEAIVDAPAARAWKVLGEEFGSIGLWSTAVDSSHVSGEVDVGAVRTCEIARTGPFSGRFTEELTLYDPEAMAFTYVATSGLPRFMTTAMNRWTIEALDGQRCRVRSRATLALVWWMRPLGPLMRWAMRRDMHRFVEEMRHRIEQGSVHPRKRLALTA